MMEDIHQEIISAWEPKLNPLHEETEDQINKEARDLVNQLQTKRLTPKSKLLVYTERGWLGQIWPWDLDKLATIFVANRTAVDLPIDYDTWQCALTQYLTRSDCNCCTKTCPKRCKLNTQGTLHETHQSLT